MFVLDQGDGLWHTIGRANGSWPFRWGICGLEKVLRRSDPNLTGSNLTDADLSNANLSGAILAADFSKAALTETNVTEAQLAQYYRSRAPPCPTASSTRTGSKTNRACGEDGENSGPS